MIIDSFNRTYSVAVTGKAPSSSANVTCAGWITDRNNLTFSHGGGVSLGAFGVPVTMTVPVPYVPTNWVATMSCDVGAGAQVNQLTY